MDSSDMIHQRVVHQVLKEKAAQLGNREFFRFQGQSFGYQDFDRLSDRAAAGLLGMDWRDIGHLR